MSTRLTSAIVLGLAIIAGPMGGSVLAQTPPAAAPTPASLQTVIATAARARAAQPGFAALTADQKAAALKAAIQAALADSGATPAVMAAALTTAANNSVIPAGLAVSIAADVAPALATQVAANITTAPAPTATASTGAVTTESTVSVLTNLQSTTTPGGTPDVAAPATVVVAPFDPCAGVVAAYCG